MALLLFWKPTLNSVVAAVSPHGSHCDAALLTGTTEGLGFVFYKKVLSELGRQSTDCFPCKHETPSSNPRARVKSWVWGVSL